MIAKEGADITLTYLSEREHNDAEETRRLVEREGRRCLLLNCHHRIREDVQRDMEATLHYSGHLEVLVNNVGERTRKRTSTISSASSSSKLSAPTSLSYFYMTKAAFTHVKKDAAIINTTSVTAYKRNPGLIDYSATKKGRSSRSPADTSYMFGRSFTRTVACQSTDDICNPAKELHMTKPAILAFTFSVLAFTMLTANAVEDQKFIDKAARGALAEIELAKLASERAQSQDVKDLAQQLMQDHQKSNDELKQIAQSKGAKIPTEPARSAKKEHDRLAKLSGAEFDREYVRFMLKDHDKDLKDFQKEAKSGKDADLKKFAADNVPVLEQHHKRVQDVQAKIGTKSKGAGAGQSGGESKQNGR